MMESIKRLLVATDLSAPASHAVERAAVLARDLEASLDILHVMELGTLDKLRRLVGDLPEEFEASLLESVGAELRQLVERMEEETGVRPQTQVASGSLLPMLTEEADDLDASLIVLGARGAGVLRRLLLGSTADRMLGKTSRPLLVVKESPQKSYSRVLVPVDFSAYSLSAIQLARKVAPQADIVLLHVFEVPFEGRLNYAGVSEEVIGFYHQAARREAVERLRKLSTEAGLEMGAAISMVLHGDISRNILDQEREQQCDLIVMGKHGEHLMEEWLLGSVTKDVLTECMADVLVSVGKEPEEENPED
ncbi:MAG: universal stress protein [Azovibrio sp.]